jgi:hypothetical protein
VATVLLGHEREIEHRRAPATSILVDGHLDDAEALQLRPEFRVVPDELGVSDAIRRRVLGVQGTECIDELVLLGAEAKVHGF